MVSRFALAATLVSLAGPVAAVGRPAQASVLPPPRPALEAVTEPSSMEPAAAQPDLRGGLAGPVGPTHARTPLPPSRPSFRTVTEPSATVALPEPPPVAPAAPSLFSALFAPRPAALPAAEEAASPASPGRARIDQLIKTHARLNGVPEALVHRVVVRESRYNPRAVGRGGAMGLMQIKTATARGVGYEGGPSGLLDAETNLTYAVKYLAGAYRTAGGDFDRSVGYYARGYYYAAKRQGVGPTRASRSRRPQPELGIEPPGSASAPVLAAAAEDRLAR